MPKQPRVVHPRDPVSEREQEPPIETPPEGATCNEHSDRPALAVCPRCGGYVCLACWHHPIRRCHACLMREPEAAAPPIPWEDPSRSIALRFFATLGSAFRPLATAPAFARGDAARARSFFLLSFLPLALLSEIVPFTHTLLFGPTFSVRVVGDARAQAIALDVAQAAGVGVLAMAAQLVALAVPYVSLTRAYAGKGNPAAPTRAVLYRAFLVPLGEVLFSIAVWAAPEHAPQEVIVFAGLLRVLPLVLLFASLRATARMGSGAGPIASIVVTIVPFVAMVVVQGWLLEALALVQPDPVAIEAQMSDAAPTDAAVSP